MDDPENIKRLLRLKRHEQPPDGFFEEFMENLKERQRAEMLVQSSRGLLRERCSAWLWGLGPGYWMLAGAVIVALILGGFLAFEHSRCTGEKSPETPAAAAASTVPGKSHAESALD